MIWRRDTERKKLRAEEIVEIAKVGESSREPAPAAVGTRGGVVQIVKPRPPLLWTGQMFDRWKAEVISWLNHGRGNYEEIFLNLIESLKKNEAIKEFVNRTLVEGVGETRTVDKIWR